MTPSHSMADLMEGFSVTMSLLLIAWGVSVLLMTRRRRIPDRAQVVVSLVLSLALLVTAVLLLPAPPIVLMAVRVRGRSPFALKGHRPDGPRRRAHAPELLRRFPTGASGFARTDPRGAQSVGACRSRNR